MISIGVYSMMIVLFMFSYEKYFVIRLKWYLAYFIFNFDCSQGNSIFVHPFFGEGQGSLMDQGLNKKKFKKIKKIRPHASNSQKNMTSNMLSFYLA